MKRSTALSSPISNKVFFVATFAIFFLAPIQGLITMWPASVFGHQIFWQIIKELILIIPLLIALRLIAADVDLRRVFLKERIIWLTGLYVLIHLIVALFAFSNFTVLAAGLVLNLRFLVFFLTCYVLGSIYKRRALTGAMKVVLIMAFLVALFGVLQMTVLPAETLAHFGYNGDPIPARFTIDDDLSTIRIASTTRGPNNLGAYLVSPIVLCIAALHRVRLKQKNKAFKNKLTWFYGLCLLLGLIAVFGTGSRSAWLGCGIAAFAALSIQLKRKQKTRLIFIVIVVGFVGLGLGYKLKDTDTFHAVILHDVRDVGGDATSNQGHLKALVEGVQVIREDNYLGCGPGCAGPASIRQPQGALISENYYLQIAQEVGIIGLILFLLIVIAVARRLYRLRTADYTAVALLASFIGISVINLLLHSWADDSLAYTWWGVAGLFIGSYSHLDSEIANAKHQRTSDQGS